MRRENFLRLAAVGLTALTALPVAAQYGGDSREHCQRAASVLLNQDVRWDDQRGGSRGGGTLNWRAPDGTYGTCAVDSRGRVYAVRVERWGTTSSGGSETWPGSGFGESSRTMRCESDKGRRRECAVPRGASVELIDRLSDAACVRGQSWGSTRDKIWVDDGCRAVFEIRW